MTSSKRIAPDLQARRKAQTSSRTRNRSWSRILLQITSHGMNYNIATILAVIAILFVLLTYVTGAPLVPVAVILLALAIIFGGNAFRRV